MPSFDLRRETALVAAELMLMPMLYYELCIATRDGEYSSGAAFNFWVHAIITIYRENANYVYGSNAMEIKITNAYACP